MGIGTFTIFSCNVMANFAPHLSIDKTPIQHGNYMLEKSEIKCQFHKLCWISTNTIKIETRTSTGFVNYCFGKNQIDKFQQENSEQRSNNQENRHTCSNMQEICSGKRKECESWIRFVLNSSRIFSNKQKRKLIKKILPSTPFLEPSSATIRPSSSTICMLVVSSANFLLERIFYSMGESCQQSQFHNFWCFAIRDDWQIEE